MKNKKTLLIIGIIILVIVITLTTFGVGIYKYQWKDSFVIQSADLIPYPAAMVNWKIIKYSEWMANVEDLKYFYSQQEELGTDLATIPTDEELEQNELDRLIDVALLMEIAKDYNITVTNQEIDDEFTSTIVPQAAGGEEEIASTLKDLYGWTIDDFKEKVVKEVVYRTKINEAIGQDESQDEKKQQAQSVLDQINAGTITFEDAAKQYSDDTSADQGGDLGYFPKGVMVKNFEDAAFALEVGQTSEVIRTQFGYHIIKVLDKNTDEDGQEQVHAEHILIKLKSVDDLIAEKEETANIKRFF